MNKFVEALFANVLGRKIARKKQKVYRDGNALSFISTIQASQVLPYFDIDSLKHTPT